MTTPTSTSDPVVTGVNGNIVTIEAEHGSLMKNQVAYVCVGEEKLKAELLRIFGNRADLQVFEDTQGVRVGDRVELQSQMLSVTLGPGLLGTVYDGLQNPLHGLAERDGFFLRRGRYLHPLDTGAKWKFEPAQDKTGNAVAVDVILPVKVIEKSGSAAAMASLILDTSKENS